MTESGKPLVFPCWVDLNKFRTGVPKRRDFCTIPERFPPPKHTRSNGFAQCQSFSFGVPCCCSFGMGWKKAFFSLAGANRIGFREPQSDISLLNLALFFCFFFFLEMSLVSQRWVAFRHFPIFHRTPLRCPARPSARRLMFSVTSRRLRLGEAKSCRCCMSFPSFGGPPPKSPMLGVDMSLWLLCLGLFVLGDPLVPESGWSYSKI